MSEAKGAGGVTAGTYVYNGFGEQVQRQTSVTTRFVYDEAGQLLGQYDINGTAIQQYHLWLDGQSVGMLVSPTQALTPNARLKYVESDQLGTPRAIIDPTRQVAIWRWDEMKDRRVGFMPTIATWLAVSNDRNLAMRIQTNSSPISRHVVGIKPTLRPYRSSGSCGCGE